VSSNENFTGEKSMKEIKKSAQMAEKDTELRRRNINSAASKIDNIPSKNVSVDTLASDDADPQAKAKAVK
ncbi:hypothetical protein HK100_008451, partial [Physocladia obscura]